MTRFYGFISCNKLLSYLLPISLLLFVANDSIAQTCQMSCADVNFSLDNSCAAQLTINDVDFVAMNCGVDFTVHLEDENDQYLGDMVSSDMIGGTFHYVVTPEDGGSPCWGNITIIDEQAPSFTCPSNISISCLMSLDDVPVLSENDVTDCSDVTISFSDVINTSFSCSTNISAVITRSYTVFDEYGNTNDLCSQIITINNAAVQNLQFPPNLTGNTALSCVDYNADVTISYPANTGYPTIDGFELMDKSPCNIGVIYDDTIEFPCDGSKKIFRLWRVWDNCVINSLEEHTQIIDIIDEIDPVVTAPDDVTLDANEIGCLANYNFPAAGILENCSGTTNISVQGPFPKINGNGGYVEGLPLGEHIITYTAIDGCGNEGTDEMVLNVKDLTPPYPVCKTGDVIALNNFGEARVPAYAFDLASYDECYGVYFKVKRMFSDADCVDPENPNDQFNDDILFCCSDATNSPIMLILRVYDRHPDEGPVVDSLLQGRFDDCMIEVFIQDNIDPVLECPPDITIDCHVDLSDLNDFGIASASDNCGYDPILEIPSIVLDQCNTGTITRNFSVSDLYGNSSNCTQVIMVKNLFPFDGGNPDMLEFPADIKIEGCGASAGPDVAGKPVINEDACALVGVSRYDHVLEIADTACYKIARTWSVIDWCQFDTGNPNPYTEENGFWSKIQYVTVIDTSGPVFDMYPDITINNYTVNCQDVFADLDKFDVTDCTPDNEIFYHFKIDLDSDGEYERFGNSNDISNTYPIGIHQLVMTADDKCGNESRDTVTLTVRDGKSPAIVLLDGLAVELMPMGPGVSMIEIIASWFDAGSYDNCTDDNKLLFSFTPDVADSIWMYDCTDVGSFDVDIWVFDEEGNSSFATTTLSIQDNAGNCGIMSQNRSISGLLTDEHAHVLSGTKIGLYEEDDMIRESELTNGEYAFENVSDETSFLLMPVKEDDPARGLSTLDILLIQQHILGLKLLDSPYKRMAADVNHSGTISAADLVEMKKVLLQVQPGYSSNLSWGFADMEMEMDENNTMQVELFDGYFLQALTGDVDIDFIGYKLGDVNESIQGSEFHSSEIRNTNSVHFNAEIKNDEISFTIAESMNLSGFQIQFEINEDAPGFSGIKSSIIDINTSDIHLFTQEGKRYMNIVWTNPDSKQVDNQEALFSLEFDDILPHGFNDLVLINNEYLNAELYDDQYQVFNIDLREINASNPGFTLSQNQPNPWNGQTEIKYSIPRDQNISIILWDLTGRKIWEYNQFQQKGNHIFTINQSEKLSPGLYFYQLNGTDGRLTKRMIIER